MWLPCVWSENKHERSFICLVRVLVARLRELVRKPSARNIPSFAMVFRVLGRRVIDSLLGYEARVIRIQAPGV